MDAGILTQMKASGLWKKTRPIPEKWIGNLPVMRAIFGGAAKQRLPPFRE
jgi:hypothetical protein